MISITKQKLLLVLLVVLPVLGLFDAGYLTYKSLHASPVVCNVLDGCSVVLESSWSTIFGIDTAVYGVVYYGVLSLFAGAYLWWRDKIMLKLSAVISSVGLLFSIWLVYVQLVRIEAVCEYCMFSAALTTVIMIIVWWQIGQVGWTDTSDKT
jgi:uncharacterized membrane protein